MSTDPSSDRLLLNDFLPYRLSVASEQVSRLFARAYQARFGIGIAEWRVMAVLGEATSRTTQEVIARTAMDRVRVSRAVIKLSAMNLVERSREDGDARARRLSLSAQGRATYTQIVPMARALQARLVAALAPEEPLLLDAMLLRIEAAAAEVLAQTP